MQFHTTPRRNGVKMVYGKSDCRRENDTLLPPPKNRMKALMKHTAIGMTVQRICRWLFHFLLHFWANMEKNIASTSLGFPAYLALRLVITAFRVPIKDGILPLQGFA